MLKAYRKYETARAHTEPGHFVLRVGGLYVANVSGTQALNVRLIHPEKRGPHNEASLQLSVEGQHAWMRGDSEEPLE